MGRILFVALSLTAFVGCASHEKNLTTDVGTMQEGTRLMDDEFYEEARNQFTRIKTEFPQSPLQLEADLKIAEAYYKEEAYVSAASAYEEFVRMHPGRPEIPRALFQLGMSYFMQMPDTPQRDTRATAKVVDTFTRLLVDYPNSEFSKDAQKYIEEARDQLATKIFEIGRFYEKAGQYAPCARRFGEVALQYPDNKMSEEALARQVSCLRRADQAEEADRLAAKFQEQFPKSEFMSMIKP